MLALPGRGSLSEHLASLRDVDSRLPGWGLSLPEQRSLYHTRPYRYTARFIDQDGAAVFAEFLI